MTRSGRTRSQGIESTDLADLIGQLQAIAVTAEKLCKVDGSKIGRMYYFDAQKAMEHSERLHELLAEWRKGQKERKW